MKFKNLWKYAILGVGTLTLTLATISVTSCSKSNTSIENIKISSLNQQINHEIYNQSITNNAILEDVKQKANNGNTSVYYIAWGSVFHKFFPLTHIFNTLQLNPNKKIIIYANNNLYNVPNDFKQKFPNVEFKTANIVSDWIQTGNNNLSYFNQFKELVNMKNFDLYLDDMTIFWPIRFMGENKYSLVNIDWNILLNNYLNFLYKASSVNLISDGTLSYVYYSNLFYEIFNLMDCRVENNKFTNSEKAYNYFKEMINSNKPIDFKNDIRQIFYFYLSPFITNDKSNNCIKTKLFLPTDELVVEVNKPTTPILTYNENSWFDPYNSLSSNLLESFNNITNQEYKNTIFALLKSPNFSKQKFEDKLRGYENYVYSMRLLENDSVIQNEAKKIIYLYNNCIDKTKKFQIVLKGHPRETKDVVSILSQEIKKLDPNINTNGLLTTLDFKIPYEIYLIEGIFTNHTDYTVKLFQTYSTIALFVFDYNKTATQKINIQNFLLSQKENNDINFAFGEDSLLFEKSLRVIF